MKGGECRELLPAPFIYIRPRIHLPLHATERHIANQTEDRALRTPRTIVLATNSPGDPCIPIGIAPIQFIVYETLATSISGWDQKADEEEIGPTSNLFLVY